MQNSKKPNKTGNILIIAILVVIAAGLLIASRFIQSPNANLSQTKIENTIQALATETPEPKPPKRLKQKKKSSRKATCLLS